MPIYPIQFVHLPERSFCHRLPLLRRLCLIIRYEDEAEGKRKPVESVEQEQGDVARGCASPLSSPPRITKRASAVQVPLPHEQLSEQARHLHLLDAFLSSLSI